MYIEKLDLHCDVERIWSEMHHFLRTWDWHPETQQLCLTHPEYVTDERDQLYVGCKNLTEHDYYGRRVRESDFTVLNRALRGTYLESLYQQLFQMSDGKLRRWRFRRQQPQTCMRFHIDYPVPRYHLALQTDENCFFGFRDANDKVLAERIPKDGHMYLFNPGVAHTAVNAGSLERIHLVGSATV